MAKKPATDWGSVARSAQERAHSAEIGDLKRQLGNYQQLVSELEAQLDVASAIGSRKLSKKALKPVTLDQGEAVAVLCASDWHVEETVTSASTNGLNEFNLGIAEDRMRKFFTSAVRLTEIQRGGCKIEQAVLWLGGDLMSGFIHEELQETNELTPTETILWLKDQLAEGIAYLRQQFSSIKIVCNYGNHGRTTKKPRHATGYKNSYEWLLYSILSSQITGDDLEWVVADSYLSFVPVYGKVIRFHHGDGLKYQGGVGGLTIPTEKAIASWNRAKVADLDVFGHWHTQQQNPKWVSNGSLIGYNAYAVSIKAGYERPQQTFFLFDRDRGRTITAPIIL
jgi:hypothetical protein